MSDSSSMNVGGIGFFGLLTIVFVTLKLLGKIAWSWFWVLSPIIFSWGIIFVIVIILMIAIIIDKLK